LSNLNPQNLPTNESPLKSGRRSGRMPMPKIPMSKQVSIDTNSRNPSIEVKGKGTNHRSSNSHRGINQMPIPNKYMSL